MLILKNVTAVQLHPAKVQEGVDIAIENDVIVAIGVRQTDNVISRQNTMNDSPGLNAVSAARWKCRSAHPCVKP